MFRDFQLTFTPKVSEYIKNIYSESKVIIEYGSGGSTLLAAKLNKFVIAVESSSEWLIELIGAYKESDLPGNIIPLWANIGKTGNWGYPIDQTEWQKWSNYSIIPWKYCSEHGIIPDVVLIDGRFRVACFISTCIFIKKRTLILFDDFVNRKKYHSVMEIAAPKQIIEDRMAVFWMEPGKINSQFLINKINEFFIPE